MNRIIVLVILLLSCTHAAAQQPELRTWTSRAGKQARAVFVEKQGTRVVLRKADGNVVSIEFSWLSDADREYVKSREAPPPPPPEDKPSLTEGSLTFAVRTKSTGKKFAPRHVFAAWVTDENGKFVKTLECNAKNYIRHLVQWGMDSGNNVVDAVTSASLKLHRDHKLTWNGRDASGQIVKDGVYRIRVEFTEINGPGPATPDAHIQFTKGPKPETARPKDLPHFKQMSLSWRPGQP